jgi:hypothetical protein
MQAGAGAPERDEEIRIEDCLCEKDGYKEPDVVENEFFMFL